MEKPALPSLPKVAPHTFIKEVLVELKKISWPPADELKLCTKVVIASTFIFGLGIYITDVIIKGALDGLVMIVKGLFG